MRYRSFCCGNVGMPRRTGAVEGNLTAAEAAGPVAAFEEVKRALT